ncbi:hypothetical protein L484_023451 [Morus notabilis]|uniref:Uncharacterized protein n=1 Tax=Morus notabilis TaxID=981085 RepID=W9RDD6_9ROSA|nr:hypothetical protein L484_023451 [Morus notabilis]
MEVYEEVVAVHETARSQLFDTTTILAGCTFVPSHRLLLGKESIEEAFASQHNQRIIFMTILGLQEKEKGGFATTKSRRKNPNVVANKVFCDDTSSQIYQRK